MRRTSERPALTLLVREGDPEAALAVAVAVGQGSASAVALSTLVEQRMKRAGFPVRAHVDQFGFRLSIAPASATLAAALPRALRGAFEAPVTRQDPAIAEIVRRWEAVRRHPFPSPALEALASCTGELGPTAEEATAGPALSGPDVIETWRRRALTAERAAIAAVGPAAVAAALARGLEQSGSWPRGAAPWPADTSSGDHGVYAAATTPSGGATLRLGISTHDPHRAVTAASRLGHERSPLSLKLGSLFPRWRLDAARASVTPAGGCLSLELRASAQGDPAEQTLASEAAEIAALTMREATSETSREPDRFLATRAIISPSDATEAAERAAWWSLAGSGGRRSSSLVSALELGSGRGEATAQQLERLATGYRTALTEARAGTSAATAEVRSSVERGQGEVWVLVATECGTDETASESGQAALAALATVMAHRSEDRVAVEPWISPNGVGVLAHDAPLAPNESPAQLAVRVARAAGQAFASGPRALDDFVAASRSLRERLSDDASVASYELARSALPGAPGRLAPLGTAEHAKDASLGLVQSRWRSLQRSPIRVAVLGNTGPAQASAAANEVQRWLVPTRGTRSCSRDDPSAVELGKGGLYHATLPTGGDERLLVAVVVRRPQPSDLQLAQLTAAALGGDGGQLAKALDGPDLLRADARVVEWPDALALVVQLETADGSVERVDERFVAFLERLRSSGLPRAELERATARAERVAVTRQSDPRSRVEALWAGKPPHPTGGAQTVERWRRWLSANLAPDRVVRVRVERPTPAKGAP